MIRHVTQLGKGKRNACGPANAAMTVNENANLSTDVDVGAFSIADNSFTTIGELMQAHSQFGVMTRHRNDADLAYWYDLLSRGGRAIALIDYREMPVNPPPTLSQKYEYAHYVTPVAFFDTFVALHDPLYMSGPILVPIEAFQRAISTPSKAGTGYNAPYQAVEIVSRSAMERSISLNYHSDYVQDHVFEQHLAHWIKNPPAALLMLDSFEGRGATIGRTLRLANALPNTTIVYRRYMGDDVQNRVTPSDFIDAHRIFAGTKVYVTANNEPHADPIVVAGWHLQVCEMALQARIRVSVGGFSVGSTTQKLLEAHAPVLRLMSKYPNLFMIDLHEYVRALWTVDFDRDAKDPSRWPTQVPTTQQLWLFGGFRRWLDYARSLGITNVRFLIGEWGWDDLREAVPPSVFGDTEGYPSCAPVWQSWGFNDPEAYGAAQLKAAWVAIYRDYPQIVGTCFYRYSQDPNNWPEFHVSDRFVFDLNKTGYPLMSTTFVAYEPGNYRFERVPSMNVRVSPTTAAAVVGSLDKGDVFEVLPDSAVNAGGYWWQKVMLSDGIRGWFAASLRPTVVRLQDGPADPTIPARIYDALDDITALLDTIRGLVTELEDQG